jgi:3-hydroxyisobutyrate dehydrogenase-like beta-hydroxyacid dehydrogenase
VDLADLARRCDVVFVVVIDDEQVTSVVSALLAVMGRTKTVIVTSTVLPATVVDLSEYSRQRGVALVDAPVSGGDVKSNIGGLTVLVGGDVAEIERCRPLFEGIGNQIFHLGPVGAGSVGKLVNNVLTMGGIVLELEAMELAAAYGITEDSAIEFISASSGNTHGIQVWGRYDRLRQNHTLAGTPAMYELTAKDLRTAAKAAGHKGVTLPITTTMGELIGPKLIERDRLLAAAGPLPPLPTCSVCGEELEYRDRAKGAHPDCLRS